MNMRQGKLKCALHDSSLPNGLIRDQIQAGTPKPTISQILSHNLRLLNDCATWKSRGIKALLNETLVIGQSGAKTKRINNETPIKFIFNKFGESIINANLVANTIYDEYLDGERSKHNENFGQSSNLPYYASASQGCSLSIIFDNDRWMLNRNVPTKSNDFISSLILRNPQHTVEFTNSKDKVNVWHVIQNLAINVVDYTFNIKRQLSKIHAGWKKYHHMMKKKYESKSEDENGENKTRNGAE